MGGDQFLEYFFSLFNTVIYAGNCYRAFDLCQQLKFTPEFESDRDTTDTSYSIRFLK